jgi:hypothetical protein
MYTIDSVQVTGDGWVEKMISTGRGGGVPGFLGEEKEKKAGKMGVRNRE